MASQDVWRLENFLDSLILELDKAQDTLSLKGMNRKLTYTVRDINMDLFVFPQYNKGGIKFSNAKPGQEGASKISFQLGSITDKQIRETTKQPIDKDDIHIDNIEGLDKDTKESFKKIGVTSARDLEALEERNVDVEKAVSEKANKPVDYSNLANLIRRKRRKSRSPVVKRISSAKSGDQINFHIHGQNLANDQYKDKYPYGLLNDGKVGIESASDQHLLITFPSSRVRNGENALTIALDPYAVLSMSLAVGGN